MASYTLYDILLIILPFLLWFIGIVKAIPAIVILSGMLMLLIGFYFFTGSWAFWILAGIGLILMIGGAVSIRK